jgi:hypothetical protein
MCAYFVVGVFVLVVAVVSGRWGIERVYQLLVLWLRHDGRPVRQVSFISSMSNYIYVLEARHRFPSTRREGEIATVRT